MRLAGGGGGGKGKGGGYGKGKGGGGGGKGWDPAQPAGWSEPVSTGPARSAAELRASLLQIDGRPYSAYRDVEGVEFDMGRFSLICDKVQHGQQSQACPTTSARSAGSAWLMEPSR